MCIGSYFNVEVLDNSLKKSLFLIKSLPQPMPTLSWASMQKTGYRDPIFHLTEVTLIRSKQRILMLRV